MRIAGAVMLLLSGSLPVGGCLFEHDTACESNEDCTAGRACQGGECVDTGSGEGFGGSAGRGGSSGRGGTGGSGASCHTGSRQEDRCSDCATDEYCEPGSSASGIYCLQKCSSDADCCQGYKCLRNGWTSSYQGTICCYRSPSAPPGGECL